MHAIVGTYDERPSRDGNRVTKQVRFRALRCNPRGHPARVLLERVSVNAAFVALKVPDRANKHGIFGYRDRRAELVAIRLVTAKSPLLYPGLTHQSKCVRAAGD